MEHLTLFKSKIIASISLLLCLTVVLCSCGETAATSSNNTSVGKTSSVNTSSTPVSSVESTVTEPSSQISSTDNSSSSSTKPTSSKKPSSSSAGISYEKGPSKASAKSDVYTSVLDIEDNIFMDALVYTGYNIKKHRADGLMWVYILAKYKKAKGWLSNITYAGGSSGYETTADGKPNIKAFERGGFVCASFATYVYFNYLPNVAGIDTSKLPKPEDSKLADSWYKAVQQWVKLGYSKEIGFTAKVDPSTRYIKFIPEENIPIGSIIIFKPYESSVKRGSHVVVYAGFKNGNHWVYHVGTKNGPEMCAVERMLYGPEAQWPIMVVTPPSSLNLESTVKNKSANSGATVQSAPNKEEAEAPKNEKVE